MRYLIAILIFIIIGQNTYADYDPTPLPQLIVESDLILQGEIIRHDSLTFTLKISDLIKGEYDLHSIQIKKFEDWECANRLPEYKTGQEEIVFLRANNKTKEWITMGAGNEGELLIQSDSIIYEDIYYDSKSGCSEFDYFGYSICGWIYSLTEFKNSIEIYIQEYSQLRIDYKKDYSIPNKHSDNKAYSRIIYESFNYFIFND